MMKRLTALWVMVFLLVAFSSAGADPDLTLRDTSVYSGSWQDAYARILEDRAAGIRAYTDYVADVTYSTECLPVGLTDLTGDGVPELIFLELETETEYGFRVGRLWIYTWNGTDTRCALSLQPEIDDLLYSSLYAGEGGLLTLHLNDVEKAWTLRLRQDRNGYYKAETVLIAEEDFSGEGPDRYYQNGSRISAKTYQKAVQKIRSVQGGQIGSLMIDDGGRGFAYTPEEAEQVLSSADHTQGKQSSPPDGETRPESPAEGLFPELLFSLGTFTKGQKFAVYSAPSAKSWRGANGKAAITSGSEIFVAGTDGSWILICYELNSGVTRVGYINSQKITGSYASPAPLTFANTPMVLAESAVLTDDPVHQEGTIGKLKKGTTVTCLAEYRGLIYVEARISGKTARGFIPPSALGLENQ